MPLGFEDAVEVGGAEEVVRGGAGAAHRLLVGVEEAGALAGARLGTGDELAARSRLRGCGGSGCGRWAGSSAAAPGRRSGRRCARWRRRAGGSSSVWRMKTLTSPVAREVDRGRIEPAPSDLAAAPAGTDRLAVDEARVAVGGDRVALGPARRSRGRSAARAARPRRASIRSVWVTPSASRKGRERKNSVADDRGRRRGPRSARPCAAVAHPKQVRGGGAELVGEHAPDLAVVGRLALARAGGRASSPRAPSRGWSTVFLAISLRAGMRP